MKRWALRRCAVAGAWLRDQADRFTARAVTRAADSGQTSIEYLGIAVVIVVIIGVLAGTTSIGQAILDAILNKITAIAGAG